MTAASEVRQGVISSEIFSFPLEGGQSIDIQVDIMWNAVEIQKPPPRPRARLITQVTHDLDQQRTAQVTIHRQYPMA